MWFLSACLRLALQMYLLGEFSLENQPFCLVMKKSSYLLCIEGDSTPLHLLLRVSFFSVNPCGSWMGLKWDLDTSGFKHFLSLISSFKVINFFFQGLKSLHRGTSVCLPSPQQTYRKYEDIDWISLPNTCLRIHSLLLIKRANSHMPAIM